MAEQGEAVAFGYFECLLRLRDPVKVRTELARLQACNSTLDAAGFDSYLYEDFVSVTFQLLEDIAAILPAHDGGAFLEAKFNEKDGPWTQVTYHFRVCPYLSGTTSPDLSRLTIADAYKCMDEIEPCIVF